MDLTRYGLSKNESQILNLFLDTEHNIEKIYNPRQIEVIINLRQPEVSLGIKRLQARGWIREGEKNLCSKRMGKTFELAMSKKMILEEIAREVMKDYDKKLNDLNEELKKYAD